MAAVNNFTHDTFTFADDGESMAKLLACSKLFSKNVL